MVCDEVRGVSREQGRTWKEPLPRVLSDGPSQPMRTDPQTKKTWLPDQDSNHSAAAWEAAWHTRSTTAAKTLGRLPTGAS